MEKELLILILNKTNVLNKLLRNISDHGIKGATVINSYGMASVLASQEENISFSPFRMLFSNISEENKTIFMVLNKEQVDIVRKLTIDLVGDLKNPNTAFIFTVPVSFVDGITCIE